MKKAQIPVKPKSVFLFLIAVAVALVLASIGFQVVKYFINSDFSSTITDVFYVDYEKNFPTLFSVFILLLAFLLLMLIAVIKWFQHEGDILYWFILALGFAWLALDEGWVIHEYLILPVQQLLHTNKGIFMVAWVVPGVILVGLLGLFFLRFIFRLPRKTRIRFIVAAIVFLGGAIVIESLSGWYASANGLTYESQNFTYSMIATVEESCEMAGVILFIRALLIYIADSYKEVSFSFGSSDEKKSIQND